MISQELATFILVLLNNVYVDKQKDKVTPDTFFWGLGEEGLEPLPGMLSCGEDFPSILSQ